MVKHHRLVVVALAGAAFCMLTAAGAAQKPAPSKDKDQDKHPSLKLTARPPIGMSPARVVLTADINGGPNDAEDYYCPTIEWDWGDGTTSETTSDCNPYEAGKSEIRRRYTIDHIFRAGNFRVAFRIKKHDKMVASATVMIEIRPGIRDL
jgi:hypothetical protein